MSPQNFPTLYVDPQQKWQAIPFGWQTDYATAAGFFVPTLTCASFTPANNGNFSEFCNADIDREIARARTLETIDQQAAAKVWAKVDHDIVDQAPWVARGTPRTLEFVSSRVGNDVYNLWNGDVLLDQMWVR